MWEVYPEECYSERESENKGLSPRVLKSVVGVFVLVDEVYSVLELLGGRGICRPGIKLWTRCLPS